MEGVNLDIKPDQMEGVNLDIKPDQMEGVNEKKSEMTPTKTFETENIGRQAGWEPDIYVLSM